MKVRAHHHTKKSVSQDCIMGWIMLACIIVLLICAS